MGTNPILSLPIRIRRSRVGVAATLAALAALFIGSCREVAVTAVDVFQVTVQPSSAQLAVGQTLQLAATAFDGAGRDLQRKATWASSDAGVATVNGAGLVNALSAGATTVTATVEGKTGQAVLSVVSKPVASVAISPPAASLQAGDSIQLQLVVKATDGSTLTGRATTWASSDTRIALVRPDGWVVALTAGSATVSAVVEGFTAQAAISVRASSGLAVAKVSVAPSTATLAAGDTLRFRATLADATGQTLVGRLVSWTSTNTAVATVDANGLVRAVAAGNTIINAFSEGVSGAAQLTVTGPRPVTIEVTPTSSSLTLGSTIQLSASVKASDGSTLTGLPIVWSSLQPAVATIDSNGLVTGLAIGTATIRAAAAGLTGTANIFVALQPVASVTILPAAPTVAVGDTLILTAELKDGNGVTLTNRTVLWTTANPAIATAAGTGPTTNQANFVGVTPGTVDVSANAEGKTATVTATVVPKAALQVTKVAASPVVSASDTIVFRITVANGGPNDASAVVVTDTLPLNATFVDATGSPTLAGNVLTWPTVATLAVGATLSDTVRMVAPATGTVTNVAAAVSSTAENDSTDNRAVGATGVNELVDLRVTKSAPAAVNAGDTIAYTVKVKNPGPSAAATVNVTDTLPGNAKYVSATGGPVQSGNTLAWPVVASLAAGDSLVFTVFVEAPAGGAVTNIAAAATTTNEGALSNNRAVATTAVLTADLAVTKSAVAAADPGDTIVYTITLANQGPGRAAGVVLRDSLPAGAAFVSATGSPSAAGRLLAWPTVAALATGGQVVQTVRVIAPAAGTTLTNVALGSAATIDPAPADNRATAATTVTVADVGVTKTGPVAAIAGDILVYVVTVTNAGPSAAKAVAVTDSLPSNATFLSSTGGAVAAGGVLTWPVVPSLAAAAAITDTVRLRAPLGGGTVANVAAVTSTTTDLLTTNNRSAVSTSVTASADLSVAKTGPPTASAGQTFVDTVTVKNLGASVAANVVVTDSLPANATFVTANPAPTSQAGRLLTWTRPSLAAGDSAVFTVTLQAPPTSALVTNIARATTSTAESSTANNRGTATTAVSALADLSVTKTGPPTASAGQTFVDTVKVKNLGPSLAAGVVVTDSLPANATFVTANPVPTSQAGRLLTWTRPSLAAGDSAMFTVTLQAPLGGGSVTNVARATTSTAESSTANNRGTATTGAGAVADLAVSKFAPPAVAAGQTFVDTVKVKNLGPSAAANVVVTDTLPGNAAYIGASGGATQVGNVLTWPAAASLAAGDSLVYTVTLQAPATSATVVNVAAAVTSTAESSTANNTASAATAVGAAADLEVTKSGPASVNATDMIPFTVKVKNLGPSTAANVVVTDTLPSNATFIDATLGAAPAGGVITWPSIASLASGDSLLYVVRVRAPATSGGVTNVAAAVSATTDVSPANNRGSATTGVGAAADLEVTKTGPATVNAGGTVQYTITVRNLGPSTATGVVRTDTLPAGVAYNTASGNPTLTGNVLTWGATTLAAGDSLKETVSITAPASGVLTNVARANSAVADPNAANDRSTVVTTVNGADLVVAKTGPADRSSRRNGYLRPCTDEPGTRPRAQRRTHGYAARGRHARRRPDHARLQPERQRADLADIQRQSRPRAELHGSRHRACVRHDGQRGRGSRIHVGPGRE